MHKDVKIGSKESDENGEVLKRSYEPIHDGRYEASNKKEREKMINLDNF